MSLFRVSTTLMQTSRWILGACVTAVALLPLAARAGQDSDQQAKERQALEQKMKQTPAPPAKPAPAPRSPAPTSGNAVWPEYKETPANPNSQALEDALHQKMSETQGQPPVAAPKSTPPAPATPAPDAAATPPPAEPAPAPAPDAAEAMDDAKWNQAVMPPQASPEQIQKAQEALQQNFWSATTGQAPEISATAGAQPATQPQTAASPSTARPGKSAAPAFTGRSDLPPLPRPPPALSAAKEQQLRDLLQQYMADKLTPEQYHAQRAKILAQP